MCGICAIVDVFAPLSTLHLFYSMFEKSLYTCLYLFNELIIYFKMSAFYDLAWLHD